MARTLGASPYDAIETVSLPMLKRGILAGVILGVSVGSLFGIVFAYARNSLPGNNDVKKSLVSKTYC